MSKYVLQSGLAGADRLRILSAAKGPSTHDFLMRLGLKDGMSCLDVGCGRGDVVLELSKIVGHEGMVVGVDRDDEVLTLAASLCRDCVANVSFRQLDVMRLAEEPIYDVVYARYLLTHLTQPKDVLAQMAACSRPGGIIAIEDIDFDGHFCYPACEAFDKYVALYQAVSRQNGGDPTIGPRLVELFHDVGIEDVRLEVVTPACFDGPGKQVAQVTLEQIAGSAVSAQLATAQEIDDTLAALAEFARQPRSVISLARTFQVWGCKRRF